MEISAQTGLSRQTGAAVVANLSAFLRLLKTNGFAVGLDEMTDALRLADAGYLTQEGSFRRGLRGLLCTCRKDWLRFDDIFAAFWHHHRQLTAIQSNARKPGKDAGMLPRKDLLDSANKPAAEMGQPMDAGESGSDEEAGGRRASSAESLATIDLRHITDPEQWAEIDALAERLAKRMKYRLSRRERARRKGRRLDFRNTMHRSIRYGGTPILLRYRNRHLKPMRLILILDASGSMSQYSAFFVRFIHGILDHVRQAEAFIFHTRLVHVTPALRERDPVKSVERMSLLSQGWGGGTRIAASLAAFNNNYARHLIHSRTAVVIVSDGYDTGEAGDLGREMAQLKRRARHIIWLNPMIGWPGYEPTAGGMTAAMPHIDIFAPAHNLESLAALETHLGRL